MILVDTSIWIHHFRESDETLCLLLARGHVYTHPFILGELRCGNVPKRNQTLLDLSALPQAKSSLDHEVNNLIESHHLMGKGMGYIDAHLLASALISGLSLWTRDKRLHQIADTLHCAYPGKSP